MPCQAEPMEKQKSQPLEEVLDALVEFRSDEQAWKALYIAMWPFVFSVTYRDLRAHSQLAEDATQDVFLRLVRYCPFDRLRTPGAFKAYLHAVSRNVARDYLTCILRHASELVPEHSKSPAVSRGEPSASEDVAIIRQRLREGFGRLAKLDQKLVRLLAEGYTHAEIARQTGLTENNVAVRLHRVRMRMAE